MQLKLGEKEEYSASGASIKKAQHAAADVALTKTTYGHPPVKPAKPNPRRESEYVHPPVKPAKPNPRRESEYGHPLLNL